MKNAEGIFIACIFTGITGLLIYTGIAELCAAAVFTGMFAFYAWCSVLRTTDK